MREVIYKNRIGRHNRRIVTIDEIAESKGYVTHTQKAFIYVVAKQKGMRTPLSAPEYYVAKVFDSKEQKEKFHFRVKGSFYLVNEDKFLKIDFCHGLKIDITKKNKKSKSEKEELSESDK